MRSGTRRRASCARMQIGRIASRKTYSGISGTRSGSRSSDWIHRGAYGSASGIGSAKGSRSSWMAARSSGTPGTTIRSRGRFRAPSRLVQRRRDPPGPLGGGRGGRHVRSKQERQGCEPEDLEDERDDRGQRGHGPKHRECQDDRQAKILERRKRGDGERGDELPMGQQGGSRRAGNRDDEKEERKAHGAAAKIGHTGPPPQEPRRDEGHANQEDRLQDEFLERRGLVREDECDRGH